MMELFPVYMILIVSPPEIANSGPPPVFNRDELVLTSQSNLLLLLLFSLSIEMEQQIYWEQKVLFKALRL